MPHGKAAMRAPCLAFAQLRIKQTHTPCAGVSMAGFDWQCSVCGLPCRAGAAKAWRLALSGEAHGGGGPRAWQGKAWGYAGGGMTRGRELEGHTWAQGGMGMGRGMQDGGRGIAGGMGAGWKWGIRSSRGAPVPNGKGARAAGGGKTVTAVCCAPAQNPGCPTTKTARGGVRTKVATGRRQPPLHLRYKSNCHLLCFQSGVLYLFRTAGFHCVPSWSYAKFTCTINCHIDLASL